MKREAQAKAKRAFSPLHASRGTLHHKIRVLLAKVGLDGHDRGVKVIARALRDAGMEVIYTGLRQPVNAIVLSAVQEDVDVVAVSILSGAHMTLLPKIWKGLKKYGKSNVLLTGGGIIPIEDQKRLSKIGIGKMFGPGDSISKIVEYIRKGSIGLVIGFCLMMPARIFAADPPSSTEASVQEKKIRERAQSELLELDREKPEIQEEEAKKKAAADSQKKFFVKDIIVRGNNAVSAAELAPIVDAYRNRELTLADANELATKIEAHYRSRGYITSLAYIPPQEISDQTLTIEVIEGKFGKLFIEGNKWFPKFSFRRYWRVKSGEVIRYRDLSRSIRQMNENPDRTVQAVLRPGEATGTSDVHLKVKDKFPHHLSYQFDNHGIRTTGKRRHGFTLRSNNFIIPDSIALGGITFGSDFGAVFAQYLVPVNARGTKLMFGFSHSQVSPKKEFETSDINGRSETYSTAIRQTLYDSDRLRSTGSLGFDFKDSRTRDTIGTRRRDRLRIAHAGIDFLYHDPWGGTSLTNQLSLGTKLFGASEENNPLAGRAGAEPDFFKYEGSLIRRLVLPYGTNAILKFSAQLSADKLTPQEEFYLGGATSVRGYPEGDYLADQGILLNVEYYIPFFFLPAEWKTPYFEKPLRKSFEFVLFFDNGYGRLRGASLTENRTRHLIGAGGGVKISLMGHIKIRIELARVLGQEPLTDSDHTRFHFTIRTEL